MLNSWFSITFYVNVSIVYDVLADNSVHDVLSGIK